MNVRASRLVATAFVLISVPLFASCGGSDEAGADASVSPSAAGSVSGSATSSASPSADDEASGRTKAPTGVRPSADEIYESLIATGNFTDRKPAAKCVAKAMDGSKLSDAYLEAALDPEVKYTPTEAEIKVQYELIAKAQADCGLATPAPSPAS